MKKLLWTIGVVCIVGGILFLVAIRFLGGRRDRVTAKSLSKDEINRINSYRSKYQQFPGPSDAEVLDVAKILVGAKLSKDDIEKFLGEPSDIRTLEKPVAKTNGDSLEYWAYDVGDSRRIEVRFDTSGNLISIHGVGVGFDTLTVPNEHHQSD